MFDYNFMTLSYQSHPFHLNLSFIVLKKTFCIKYGNIDHETEAHIGKPNIFTGTQLSGLCNNYSSDLMLKMERCKMQPSKYFESCLCQTIRSQYAMQCQKPRRQIYLKIRVELRQRCNYLRMNYTNWDRIPLITLITLSFQCKTEECNFKHILPK